LEVKEMPVTHRAPLACIVPPFVLDALARSGDAEQRAAALDALMLDMSIRDRRSTAAISRSVFGVAADTSSLLRPTLAAGEPQRRVFNANNRTTGVPTLARSEGDGPTSDEAVDEAYEGFGDTYRFFWEIFGRDSIDDNGLPLLGVVHFGVGYDNAFWDGQQMVFGDGRLFKRLTLSLDVIGHELQHGVTEHESGLLYQDQSGALNESLSDIFGSLVKQLKRGETAEAADWLIGADIVGPNFPGRALRDMANPGTAWERDPQPAHMDNFVVTADDNGGVHINSGIPNKAFHTLAIELGGNAWERAGAIWYETLRHYRLEPSATFRSFARLTEIVANRMYGLDSAELAAVSMAWDAVGVLRSRNDAALYPKA
jgi:Zn-dependent metalloprotease